MSNETASDKIVLQAPGGLVPDTADKLETANLIIQRLKGDVTHLQGVVGNLWNERSANFRRNVRITGQEMPSNVYDEMLAEKRVVSAAFKVVQLIEFTPNMGADNTAEFHLAIRRLLEVRTGNGEIPLTRQEGEKASKISYEEMLELAMIQEPPPLG